MYIEENVLMMMFLGVMFMIACLGGVGLGSFLTKLNQQFATATVPATGHGRYAPVPVSMRPSQNKYRMGGHWQSHVFKQAPYATIEDYIAQLNSRGIRVTSVTQSDGDRFCTVYGEEWVPG